MSNRSSALAVRADLRDASPPAGGIGAAACAQACASTTTSARAAPRRDLPRASPRSGNLPALLFAMGTIAALGLGWSIREEQYLTPEKGTGYWLGIVGGSMMLALLLYPLRKHFAGARLLGSVAAWFRIHMMLGIIGPLLILYHANFKLGSLNSNVALFTMLTVAASGVVGRFLYARIHKGLYGRKAEVRELRADVDELRDQLSRAIGGSEQVREEIAAFERRVTTMPRSLAGSAAMLLSVTFAAPASRGRIVRHIRHSIAVEAVHQGWSRRTRRRNFRDVRRTLDAYFTAVGRTAAFHVFDRLFALWHVLHLPLFVLLVAAAVVHVYAVHFY